jgi:hypothetical protein
MKSILNNIHKFKWHSAIAVLMTVFTISVPVFADNGLLVTESSTTEDSVVLYVKNAETCITEEASFQAGTTACEIESIKTVKEMSEPIYTLIIWDDSDSVMSANADTIKEILVNLVANRAPNEVFSIALPDEELQYLTEYTSDYSVLKEIIEGVSGEEKDSYWSDNLYDVIQSFEEMTDGGYKRIIAITDGEDKTENGYTWQELESLLDKSQLCMETIGIESGDESNMQSFFALSRKTDAPYFYLSEAADVMSAVQMLSEDYSIVQVKVTIPEEMRDGSTQNSLLTLPSGSVQHEVVMPFGLLEDNTEDTEETEDADNVEETAATGNTGVNPILIVVIVAAVVIIIVLLLMIRKLKKTQPDKKPEEYRNLDRQIKNERRNLNKEQESMPFVVPEKENKSTVITPPQEEKTQRGKTRRLFDEPEEEVSSSVSAQPRRHLILQDMEDPIRAFQGTIQGGVIIGRTASKCNIVITSDNAVSEQHCEITWEKERLYVRDVGSSNGTYVDGRPISEKTELKSDSTLKIGRHKYRVSVE